MKKKKTKEKGLLERLTPEEEVIERIAVDLKLSSNNWNNWMVVEENRQRAFKENAERLKEIDRTKVHGQCIVCQGDLKKRFETTATTSYDRIPIGPGSRDYFVERFMGYDCENCGLTFQKIPPQTNKTNRIK